MAVNLILCPLCNYNINVYDWFWNYSKSDWPYYFTCKGCKNKLGSTLLLDGEVSVWDKSTEIK